MLPSINTVCKIYSEEIQIKILQSCVWQFFNWNSQGRSLNWNSSVLGSRLLPTYDQHWQVQRQCHIRTLRVSGDGDEIAGDDVVDEIAGDEIGGDVSDGDGDNEEKEGGATEDNLLIDLVTFRTLIVLWLLILDAFFSSVRAQFWIGG